MYSWLQALASALALSINRIAPDSSFKPGLIGRETVEWVETIRQKYDIPGISLGVVASPNRTGHEWVTEAHGFGHMDDHDRHIDGEVCHQPCADVSLLTDHRRCSQSHRTRSFL
jgi:hypothetical protein